MLPTESAQLADHHFTLRGVEDGLLLRLPEG